MIESLAARIRDKWVPGPSPLLPEITTAASLAHHGLLGSLRVMWLHDEDLSSVPAEHLASLTACVTEDVDIWDVSNTDLTGILDSSKSIVLDIFYQSLSTEETRAVVRAMANVVSLGLYGEVTLNISTLVTYDGRGKCKKIRFYNNTAEKYREEVRRWAQRISWRVTSNVSDKIIIERE